MASVQEKYRLRGVAAAFILVRMQIFGDIDKEACSTWIEIDLGALERNFHFMEEKTQRLVMPVVKANGYGLGLVEVSSAFERAGAKWLGIARIEEALSLRQAGLRCNLLILGYTPPKRIPDAIKESIDVTVYDREVAGEYLQQAEKNRGLLNVHLKVDTGMGRLGIFPAQVQETILWVQAQKNLRLNGLCTHFARADEPVHRTTIEQIDKFDELLKELRKNGMELPIIHASNSAAAVNYPSGRYDIVRCGISLFGIDPGPMTSLPEEFEPVMSWKTHLTSIKILPPGHGVSYGFHYFTKKSERIGVIAIGYADGYRRQKGNIALVHGKRVPVVGAVCMDQCMLQLDEVPEARIGDEVVLIGRQGKETITANDLARDWGTIPYEVMCGLADRIPRFYLR